MPITSTDDDPYAILGVPRGSSDRAITAAHRRLARRHHPDIAGDGSTADMMRINAAFDAIRTAARRVAFDAMSGWTAPPAAADARAASTPTEVTGPDALRWRPPNDGTGAAGPPPGRASGSVLGFGRHRGWSIGEIARVDPGYLEWLEDRREGQPYLEEIAATLARIGFRTRRPTAEERADRRRAVFRRG
jgi:curved DNA-binding protein CbpA